MKKTIALLFALSAVAMGAERLTLDWDDNCAAVFPDGKFTWGSDAVTVAVELNLDKMRTTTDSAADAFIFALSTKEDPVLQENWQHGASFEIDSKKNKYIDYLSLKYVCDYNIFSYTLNDVLLNASSAALVYTSDQSGNVSYNINMYLYAYDSNGDLMFFDPHIAKDIEYKYTDSSNGVNKSIVYNATLVEGIDVYAGIEDAGAAADRVLNPTYSPIPEPTTATLSLLALAGLAARRRRR